MQDNTLTLAVDVANSGSTTNETYTRYEEYQNRAVYIGANHTPDNRDTLSIYRTFPTKSGNFKGTGKTAVKFTKDTEVAAVDSTTITAPIILELSMSVPVGTDVAELVHARQRLLTLLDTDAFMNSLSVQLMI